MLNSIDQKVRKMLAEAQAPERNTGIAATNDVGRWWNCHLSRLCDFPGSIIDLHFWRQSSL